jgi:hypothetical protein
MNFRHILIWDIVASTQVRSRMASVELDGILLPTNGLTTSSAGMVNVFMSIEHQSTLSCNQLVMQVIIVLCIL